MTDPTQMTVFSLMKARLQMLGERQKVIAQNVANVSTPGYVPNDINQQAFSATLQRMSSHGGVSAPGRTAMVATQAGHMAPPPSGGSALMAATKSPDSETTLDGNAVVVEEQMLKMAESRMAYDAAIGFYQKSMSMIRMAAKRPGA